MTRADPHTLIGPLSLKISLCAFQPENQSEPLRLSLILILALFVCCRFSFSFPSNSLCLPSNSLCLPSNSLCLPSNSLCLPSNSLSFHRSLLLLLWSHHQLLSVFESCVYLLFFPRFKFLLPRILWPSSSSSFQHNFKPFATDPALRKYNVSVWVFVWM